MLKCANGGEAAARALIDLGVDTVFTLTGGHLNHIHQILEKSSVRLVSTRHEQAATFMGDAYARMTGKTGVVMLTAGPGFTNCISPLQQAATNCTPLLLIAGASGTDYRDKMDLQDARQVDIARPIVKEAYVCTQVDRVAEYVEMAYRQARTGRPGPVFLELPCDILGKPMPDGECRWFKTINDSHPVDMAGVEKTLDLLEKAERPIVIVGSGGGYARAGEALKDFAEKAGVPVFTCNMGCGLLSDLHPLCFGLAGPHRPLTAEKAYRETDLAIILGNRISLNHYFGSAYNRDATLVQVDICAEEPGRNRAIALPIVSDVRAFLELAELGHDPAQPAAAPRLCAGFRDLAWRSAVPQDGGSRGRQGLFRGQGRRHPPRAGSGLCRRYGRLRQCDGQLGDRQPREHCAGPARRLQDHRLERHWKGCRAEVAPRGIPPDLSPRHVSPCRPASGSGRRQGSERGSFGVLPAAGVHRIANQRQECLCKLYAPRCFFWQPC